MLFHIVSPNGCRHHSDAMKAHNISWDHKNSPRFSSSNQLYQWWFQVLKDLSDRICKRPSFALSTPKINLRLQKQSPTHKASSDILKSSFELFKSRSEKYVLQRIVYYCEWYSSFWIDLFYIALSQTLLSLNHRI